MAENMLEKLLADPKTLPEGLVENFAAEVYERVFDAMVKRGYTSETVGGLAPNIELSICRIGADAALDVGMSLMAGADVVDKIVNDLSSPETITRFFDLMTIRKVHQAQALEGEAIDDKDEK